MTRRSRKAAPEKAARAMLGGVVERGALRVWSRGGVAEARALAAATIAAARERARGKHWRCAPKSIAHEVSA